MGTLVSLVFFIGLCCIRIAYMREETHAQHFMKEWKDAKRRLLNERVNEEIKKWGHETL